MLFNIIQLKIKIIKIQNQRKAEKSLGYLIKFKGSINVLKRRIFKNI